MTIEMRHRRGSCEVLLEHRARGATLQSAAAAAGMSPRTAYRREREPGYQEALAEIYQGIALRAGTRLTAEADRAVGTLVDLLDEKHPASVRIRAADLILRHGLRFREGEEAQQRMATIERIAEEQNQAYETIRSMADVLFGSADQREITYGFERRDA
jgi:hypothetical protein